ncbi:MAG: ribosome maturation factor RimP [Sphingobacteriia bacterium]|nr:ribosome maturation factor RimP [Sphingobacteriia bacterium]
MINEKIFSILDEPLKFRGYEIIKINYKKGPKRSTLQIFIERIDGKAITIDDCEKASKAASLLLDANDPISGEYNLEMSSPGIDRPLTRLKDFQNYIGFDAKISLKLPIEDRKNFSGIIANVQDNNVIIKSADGQNIESEIDFDNIHSAKLILTDRLIDHYKKTYENA